MFRTSERHPGDEPSRRHRQNPGPRSGGGELTPDIVGRRRRTASNQMS